MSTEPNRHTPADELTFLRHTRDAQAAKIRQLQREVDCMRYERDQALQGKGDSKRLAALKAEAADLKTQLAKAEADADRWHLEAMKRRDATV